MDLDLPPDLADLERRLVERPGAASALRARVLTAVKHTLGRERGANWRFLVATAAATIFGVNLSMSVGLNIGRQAGCDGADLETTTQQVRALDPSLSDDEVRREALLLKAGGQLSPGPDLGAVPSQAIFKSEGESWGTR